MAVKSADRTLQLLELFASVGEPMTLAEISHELAAPKSSCLALLNTLAARGYVYRMGSAPSWYPSRRWLECAQAVHARDPIAQTVREALVRLRDATGETAVHATLIEDQAVYLDVVESLELVRYHARIGDVKPLHVSASGRAQLSLLDDARLHALLQRLPLERHIGRGAFTAKALLKIILEARARGYASNVGEFRVDVASVAAGFEIQGSLHAVTITAPLHRAQARIDQWGRLLRKEANMLESEFSRRHRRSTLQPARQLRAQANRSAGGSRDGRIRSA